MAEVGKPRRRGYSREFTPAAGDPGRRICLDRVPSDLFEKVQKRCDTERISVRAAVLGFLARFADKQRGPVAAAAKGWKVWIDGVNVTRFGIRRVEIEVSRPAVVNDDAAEFLTFRAGPVEWAVSLELLDLHRAIAAVHSGRRRVNSSLPYRLRLIQAGEFMYDGEAYLQSATGPALSFRGSGELVRSIPPAPAKRRSRASAAKGVRVDQA